MNLIKIGVRVQFKRDVESYWDEQGVVRGYAFVDDNGRMEVTYIVELNNPGWVMHDNMKDRRFSVSHVLIHPDNLEMI